MKTFLVIGHSKLFSVNEVVKAENEAEALAPFKAQGVYTKSLTATEIEDKDDEGCF